MKRCIALSIALAVPAAAQEPGTRFGLVVTTMEEVEIVAERPDDRFVPASNTKMFTTAAAFATLGDVTIPDAEGGAAVRLEARDVVLEGHGDARLSSAADCVVDCLATLADAVAAKTRAVRDVIGDDSWFPDERWSPGMSWNNIPTRSGTGISALTLDDNEEVVTVSSGIAASGYYRIENDIVPGPKTAIGFARTPGSRDVRINGTMAAGAVPVVLRLGIDDPAEHAAWRLAGMLRERGVVVKGKVSARHRPLDVSDNPAVRKGAPAARPPQETALAQSTPPPLADDLTLTNKVSQNLHAELLLRRVGRVTGSGSIADGQAAVAAMLAQAGVERWRYDFADGSGMSSYNRVSPRGVARFLRWTTGQPWGAAWRATLPVGGVDGTLKRRFVGTVLEGKVFAKTGSLDKAAGLAGFLVAASGRTLIFASYANDMAGDASATKAMDAALVKVAAAN